MLRPKCSVSVANKPSRHCIQALFSAEVLVASCDFTYKEEEWKNCSVLGGWGRCETDGPYNFSDKLIFTSHIAAINLMQTSRYFGLLR